MSHIASIMKKEIREMLTPGSVASIIVMVVLFAGLGLMINGEVERASTLPTIGIVADDASYYDYEYTDSEGVVVTGQWSPIEYLKTIYGDYADRIVVLDSSTSATDEEITAEMEERGIASAIVMPGASDFQSSIRAGTSVTVKQLYLYEPTGMFGTVSTTSVGYILSYLNSDLSSILILERGYTDYTFITSPITYSTSATGTLVEGVVRYNITPDSITSAVTSQTMMIPLVIMIIIMMVGSIVISSMGSEKENKTLETLLTLPIKRTSVVAGKILAAAIVGLIYGLAYMAGMSIYMGSMTSMLSSSSGSVNLADIGMSLELTDWILVMLSMFLAIVCALGICMILGAFSKNYKSAQSMTMPLSILAIIPMFVIMFSGWYGSGTLLQAVCFIIPFSHPMMAMQSLMYGDTTLVLEGIAYMAVFAMVTILITVRLYKSDILITGLGQNKYVQRLTGKVRHGRFRCHRRGALLGAHQGRPGPRQRGHGRPGLGIRPGQVLPRMRRFRTGRPGPRLQDGRRQDGDRRQGGAGRGLRHEGRRRHVVAGADPRPGGLPRRRGHRPSQGEREMGRRRAVLLRRRHDLLLRDRQGPPGPRRDRHPPRRGADAPGRDAHGQRPLPVRRTSSPGLVLRPHGAPRDRDGRGHGPGGGRSQHIREDSDAQGRQQGQGREDRPADSRIVQRRQLRGVLVQGDPGLRRRRGLRGLPEGQGVPHQREGDHGRRQEGRGPGRDNVQGRVGDRQRRRGPRRRRRDQRRRRRGGHAHDMRGEHEGRAPRHTLEGGRREAPRPRREAMPGDAPGEALI